MKTKTPKSSIRLGKVGAKFRRDVLKEYHFNDSHDFRRLDLASHCLDRIAECNKVVEAEGVFIQDRFEQKKEHPAVKVERDQKVVFCRIIRELNLDIESAKESRPPSLY
jgi:phage terminase small subunit